MNDIFSFTTKSIPKCESFFKIKWPEEQYVLIEEFIKRHPNISQKDLEKCDVIYRQEEKTFKKLIEESLLFSSDLRLVNFNPFSITIDRNIEASKHFMKKTMDCLQNARLFTMKCHQIIDMDFNLNWESGYIPQFMMRCLYFDTATTWYSNTFDQLLQAVYWAYELYTSATDRDGNSYDDTWHAKKVMTFCTYEFVVGELKDRGLTKVRKFLTSCSGNIETVRCWANYIKHKGGVEYKYLEPENPFEIFIQIDDENQKKTEIENFKSPIEIDIDQDIQNLVAAHHALYSCINDVITEIDYEKFNLTIGG